MDDRKKLIRGLLDSAKSTATAGGEISVVAAERAKVTVISKSKVTFFPGIEYISDEQALYIKQQVNEVVRMERVYSQRDISVPMVWNKLKGHMRVTSYKLIPKEMYSEAVGYLLDWQARIMEDRTRPEDALQKRDENYRKCHNIAKRYGLYPEMRTLMDRKWQTETMRTLEDHQLDELRAFMCALETEYKKMS